MADDAVISSIKDEIEKCARLMQHALCHVTRRCRYASLSHDCLVTCLSGVGDKPLVISTDQARCSVCSLLQSLLRCLVCIVTLTRRCSAWQ